MSVTSITAVTEAEAIERIDRQDPTLRDVFLYRIAPITHALPDYLLAHPNVITHLWISDVGLFDDIGIRIAQYLAISSEVESLSLSHNNLTEPTYLAIAAALRVNTSLGILALNNNTRQHDYDDGIDMAFIDALRINPNRPSKSYWWLYQFDQNEYKSFEEEARRLGHPTLQMLLVDRC